MFNEDEETKFWASFGYEQEKLVYCPMCDCQHKNTTECQRTDPWMEVQDVS